MFWGQLTRSSLGQFASIGDLYDATTDRFTGQSVLTSSGGSLVVSSMPMESCREEFLIDATSYDRLALLVNDKELQLSVVLRMVVPEQNVAAFIDQDEINMSAANGILLRSVTTVCEHAVSIADFEHLVSSYDVTSESATHVVVGIVWGATVAIHLDKGDTDIPSEQPLSDNLRQQLQMLMSTLKSGARPDFQLTADIKRAYSTRCFSNGLSQYNQPYRTSLEDAMASLSNLPRLIQSVNNGKGAPQSFILMPLSLLTECSASVPCRVKEPVLSQTLAVLSEVIKTKQKLVSLSQSIGCRRSYLQQQEIGKIDVYVAGFQQVEKTFYDDIARAVRHDQSRVADVIDTFSHGRYSADSLRTFLHSIEPTLQKIKFLDKLIHEGVVIIGDSQTNLRNIIRNADIYILYATNDGKRQNPRVWEENCSIFLDIINEEKRKHRRTSGYSSLATFAYIDCDIVREACLGRQIAIYHYKQGQCVSHNVADDRAVYDSLNVATSSQRKRPFLARPVKRAIVELPCPGAASSRCGNHQRIWSCEDCRGQLEYGFDDCFYCSCGRAPVNTFSYKCNGIYHGDELLAFQPRVVDKHVRNMTPIRELNILVLGETGVGKSTWINGFVNYITYSTLSEAENSDNVCLIPMKFTVMNEKLEAVEIKSGSHKNEDQQVGQSSTQMPKSYVFRRGRIHVKIIDTPGIGDTRGNDHDKINLQNIMTHLSNLDEINGICILLKPNNAQLSAVFSFYIKELLTHLHRDACRNIVFCFTNARTTFYEPGDTLPVPALRELIASNKIDLQLCKQTVYCIDNEAVRFLAAQKQGVRFREDAKKNFTSSWEFSVKETKRLIDYISSLPPRRVKNSPLPDDARRRFAAYRASRLAIFRAKKNSLLPNDARQDIVVSSSPLGQPTIQRNIGMVKQGRQEVEQGSASPASGPNPACELHRTGLVTHLSLWTD